MRIFEYWNIERAAGNIYKNGEVFAHYGSFGVDNDSLMGKALPVLYT
jgi:hypothetical protein